MRGVCVSSQRELQMALLRSNPILMCLSFDDDEADFVVDVVIRANNINWRTENKHHVVVT